MFGSCQPDHRPLAVVGDLQGPIANDQSGHALSSAARAIGATRVVVSLDGRRNSLAKVDCPAVQPQSKSGHVWCQARCAMQSAWSVISDTVPYKALALLVFWILGLHEVSRGQQNDLTCEASFGFHAYPTFDAPQWSMGMPLQSGQAYDELNRRVLAPVPMAVWVPSDSDLVTGYCEGANPTCGGGRYRQEAIMGFLDTSWEIDPLSTTGSCGAFMNEMGLTEESGAGGGPLSPILTRDDQSVVLFVPPSDLNCSEVRLFKIRAVVWESRQAVAPGLIDGATALEFNVRVECTPQRTFNIRIDPPTTSPLPLQLDPVQADGAGYCGASFAYSQSSAIAGNVTFNDKIGVGDIRPLVATYLDQDGVTLRCGEGGGGCFGLSDPHAYHSALSYEWEFVGTPPAGVELLAGTTDKQVALLSVDSKLAQGCEVEIKLTVKDIGPALAHDGDVEKFIKIRVFDFKFIDQDNVAIPREHLREDPKYLDSACLRVSQRPTAAGINHTQQVVATWDGPVPATSDPRLFRFQVDSNYAGAPSLGAVDVRVIRRPQPGNNALPVFDYVYTCQNAAGGSSGPAPFRVLEQIRLVSNPNDDMPVLSMLDEQSIRVQLGDRIRAELLVDGQHATFLELPVGAPPLGLPAAKNAIKTINVRFLRVELNSVPNIDTQATVDRMSEDLAQIGVRVKASGTASVVRYRANMLVVQCAASTATSYEVQGSFQVGGQQIDLDEEVPQGLDSVAAPRHLTKLIASAVAAQSGLPVRHAMYAQYGCIVINPGFDVSIQVITQPSNASLTSYVPVWYGSGYPLTPPIYVDLLEQTALCMNYSDNYDSSSGAFSPDMAGAATPDYYVVDSSVVLSAAGITFPANTVPWANDWIVSQAPFCGTTFLYEGAVDADDSTPPGWWPAAGHELVHHLARCGAPPPPTVPPDTCKDGMWHILSDSSHLMKGTAGIESWNGPKRLPNDVCYSAYKERDIRIVNSFGGRNPQMFLEICE